MTLKELNSLCAKKNIPDDVCILEALFAGDLVDLEYDKDSNAILLIFS